MSEILTKKGMEHVFSHETFTLEAWLVLLGLINQRCAFFRMVDRLKQDLESGRKPAMSDLILKWTWKTLSRTKRTSSRSSTISRIKLGPWCSASKRRILSRRDLALTYRLEPGEKYWWSAEALPLATEGDDDVLGKMSGLLKDNTVSWQTLIPTTTGGCHGFRPFGGDQR